MDAQLAHDHFIHIRIIIGIVTGLSVTRLGAVPAARDRAFLVVRVRPPAHRDMDLRDLSLRHLLRRFVLLPLRAPLPRPHGRIFRLRRIFPFATKMVLRIARRPLSRRPPRHRHQGRGAFQLVRDQLSDPAGGIVRARDRRDVHRQPALSRRVRIGGNRGRRSIGSSASSRFWRRRWCRVTLRYADHDLRPGLIDAARPAMLRVA
jgi:hypothetical protein